MVLLASGFAIAAAPIPEGRPADRFAAVSIHLERNVTDHDAEAVIEAVAGRCALRSLLVSRPDGVVVAAYDSRGRDGLGGQEVLIESPEPTEEDLVHAYPEGRYTFIAETLCGRRLSSEARLIGGFPLASRVIAPPNRSRGIARAGLVLRWSPVAGVDHYQIELEQSGYGTILRATVPGAETSLPIPEALLHPGSSYQVGVGTFSADGNASFVETTFSTGRAAGPRSTPH